MDEVLRYLKAMTGQGIFFSSNVNLGLEAYCDSEWDRCPITRRSSTIVFYLEECPSLGTQRNNLLFLNPLLKVEYRAMASTVSEIMWLH